MALCWAISNSISAADGVAVPEFISAGVTVAGLDPPYNFSEFASEDIFDETRGGEVVSSSSRSLFFCYFIIY
jgi:hypothetical protein